MVKLLVVYDVRDNKNKLFKYLKSIGKHIQNSVFEVDVKSCDIDKISQEIYNRINIKSDKIIVYNLGNSCNISRIEIGCDKSLGSTDKRYIII